MSARSKVALDFPRDIELSGIYVLRVVRKQEELGLRLIRWMAMRRGVGLVRWIGILTLPRRLPVTCSFSSLHALEGKAGKRKPAGLVLEQVAYLLLALSSL